jgi:hypothetical protein
MKTLIFLLSAYCGLLITFAEAATIQEHVNDQTGCGVIISGIIEEGDAQRLANIIEEIFERDEVSWEEGGNDYFTPLCLDSRGGSFAEALNLIDVIDRWQLNTFVPADANCESACAIAFMAGGSRTMHATSRLGFHAPELRLPEGNFNREDVLRGYRLALFSIAELSRRRANEGLRISESLIVNILDTPFDSMWYVDTVGKASRLGIGVAGISIRPASLEEIVAAICYNAQAHILDRSTDIYYAGENAQIAIDNIARGVPDTTTVPRLSYSGSEHYFAETQPAFFTEGSYQCRIFDSGFIEFFIYDGWGNGYTIFPDSGGRWAEFMTYPPDTLIQDASLISGQTQEDFRLQMSQRASAASDIECGFSQDTVLIANVNEFVNIRSDPSLRGSIVAQARLGERLTLIAPSQWWFMDTDRGRQCSRLCEQAQEYPSLQSRLQQCIEEAEIWHEVRNDRGQTGFVSVYFLEGAQ